MYATCMPRILLFILFYLGSLILDSLHLLYAQITGLIGLSKYGQNCILLNENLKPNMRFK